MKGYGTNMGSYVRKKRKLEDEHSFYVSGYCGKMFSGYMNGRVNLCREYFSNDEIEHVGKDENGEWKERKVNHNDTYKFDRRTRFDDE